LSVSSLQNKGLCFNAFFDLDLEGTVLTIVCLSHCCVVQLPCHQESVLKSILCHFKDMELNETYFPKGVCCGSGFIGEKMIAIVTSLAATFC